MNAERRIAYVMSRFPKLTETFVLYEMLAVEKLGVKVEVFPLLRQRQTVHHPEAAAVATKAHYQPFFSWAILRSNLRFAASRPRRYLRALAIPLRAAWGNWNFLGGAAAIFPKVVHAARLMEKMGVRHVHAHFANHPATAAFMIHCLTGIPYSFVAHGSDLHVDTRMLAEKVGASAFTVAISNFNREFMVRACGEELRSKIVVNHCGVNLNEFEPRLEPKIGGPFRILCIASLEEVKGHRHLVRACRMLTQRGLDWSCDLVGDGPMRANIEGWIEESGLSERMELLGPLPRPRVIELLKKADAVVLPSIQTAAGKREGIPVALMEAMACALPVVSSRLSGIPELVTHGETGFLTDPGDDDALAKYLERLASRPQLRQSLGEAGRRRVAREFDLDANSQNLIQLFRERAPGFGQAEAAPLKGLSTATESTA